VPTLEAVLDSSQRPKYWWRSLDPTRYDVARAAWDHRPLSWLESRAMLADPFNRRYLYDTTIEGYRNTGHPFGDSLSKDERAAVLEYLKGL
jgi:hypothetical protein